MTTTTIGSKKYYYRRLHAVIKELHPELSSAQVHETARARVGVDSLKNADENKLYSTIKQIESEIPRSGGARSARTARPKQSKKPRQKPRGPMGKISKSQTDYIDDLRLRVQGMANDQTFRMWVANHYSFVVNPIQLDLLNNKQGQQIIGGLTAMEARGNAP